MLAQGRPRPVAGVEGAAVAGAGGWVVVAVVVAVVLCCSRTEATFGSLDLELEFDRQGTGLKTRNEQALALEQQGAPVGVTARL